MIGVQKMQRLAAEKIHGTHGFQKQRGRRRHATCDDGLGDPFEQGEVLSREVLLFRANGEGMPETSSKILCAPG